MGRKQKHREAGRGGDAGRVDAAEQAGPPSSSYSDAASQAEAFCRSTAVQAGAGTVTFHAAPRGVWVQTEASGEMRALGGVEAGVQRAVPQPAEGTVADH